MDSPRVPRVPLDVCCHTHHRSPGQPCRWGPGRPVQPPCFVRTKHFEVQKAKAARGEPLCPVCAGYPLFSSQHQHN